jgi:hypothetical protein
MNIRLRNYLSCFGPQFVRGISVLAEKSGYERRAFRALTRPYLNFFELDRLQKPHSRQARDIRSAVWGAIVIAWIVMIAMLAMLRIPLAVWLVIAILVSVIAPRSLLGIAALCLPKAPGPKKSASQR